MDRGDSSVNEDSHQLLVVRVTESDGRGLDLTKPEWQKKRKKMASRAGQASGRTR